MCLHWAHKWAECEFSLEVKYMNIINTCKVILLLQINAQEIPQHDSCHYMNSHMKDIWCFVHRYTLRSKMDTVSLQFSKMKEIYPGHYYLHLEFMLFGVKSAQKPEMFSFRKIKIKYSAAGSEYCMVAIGWGLFTFNQKEGWTCWRPTGFQLHIYYLKKLFLTLG